VQACCLCWHSHGCESTKSAPHGWPVEWRAARGSDLRAVDQFPRAFSSLCSLHPNRAGGALAEQQALADVAAQHCRASVCGLVGDDALGNARLSSGRRKPCPQRVSGRLVVVQLRVG
jgi:hypothetical protein